MAAEQPPTWHLTQHACRACFGRVLKRYGEDGGPGTYLCSNCGAVATGRSEAALCACGTRLRNGKDAGLRCVSNPDPRPEFPGLVVVTQVVA